MDTLKYDDYSELKKRKPGQFKMLEKRVEGYRCQIKKHSRAESIGKQAIRRCLSRILKSGYCK